MRVIVPYFPGLLHPRTIASIVAQGYVPERRECVNRVGHPQSYPMILTKLFESGEDFCIVEHDIESRPGFLGALEDCPSPWCFNAYDFSIPWEEAIGQPSDTSAPLGVYACPLGHTRFRGGLYETLREVLHSDIFQMSWVGCDTWLGNRLNDIGMIPHRHPGKVIHHHPYAKRPFQEMRR